VEKILFLPGKGGEKRRRKTELAVSGTGYPGKQKTITRRFV